MIDTLRAVQTPEGIDLHLPVAGLIPRSLAWLIDALIRGAIYTGFFSLLAFFGNAGWGIFMLIAFITEWFYPVLFEVLRDGQTPGKRTYNIKAIHDDGTPISWSASLIRNFIRVVDFLPVMYGFGIISMMLTRDFKSLGDLAAGTIVVYREESFQQPDLPDTRPIRPAYSLLLEEQQAIIGFAERTDSLTAERADELARVSGLFVQGEKQPVETIRGMAKWLTGERGQE